VPFTISHVAAVIPGYRLLSRAHVFTAAVIGSMVPDFGLLIPPDLLRWQTHSVLALFTFCLPAGLLTYWLTQLVIKPAMLEILPDRPFLRLQGSEFHVSATDIRHWVAVGLAILIGAVTHLIWDGFTHEDAHGVRMFPVLSDYGPEMAGHPVHIYRWLQYGSSVLGLLIVVAALILWWRQAPRPHQPTGRRIGATERAIWLSAYLLLPLLFIVASVWQGWSTTVTAFGASGVVGVMAVDGMRALFACLVLLSVLIRTRLAA
jgi:hypothetical protein